MAVRTSLERVSGILTQESVEIPIAMKNEILTGK